MARVSRKRKQEQAVEKLAVSRDEVYQCAVYIRLSKEENEKSDSHKLDNQEQVILNYVRKNSDLKIVKIYCDNGYSGTNFSRAAFGEMMQDIKSGIIRCVIVKDLSRLGRNHIETEQYIRRNVYKNERVTYNYVTSKSRKNDGTYYKFVYISEEKVFQALKKAIYFYIELLFSIENSHMDRKRKEKAEIEQKQLKKEIANSQKNVEWYTRRLADTYKEKTEGKIQMEDYIKKQTEYRACKEAAQEKIKELSDKYEIYKMQLLGNPDYFAVYETFLKTEELNKMLIDVLVKKITVAENAKIEITFQFEDEMRMLYERLKESCSA